MKNPTYETRRTITVAELCQALESGSIPAQMEDGMYVVRSMDLRRFTNPTLRMPVTSKSAVAVLQKAS